MNKSWQECSLGEILEIERGGSPRPIKEYITQDTDGINWVKISDTKNITKYIQYTLQKIKPSGLQKSRKVYPGDFILSNSMSFGKPYIMDIEGAIHDGWLVLRDNNNLLNKDYLYHILSSPFVYNQFSKLAKGSSVKNLNINLVSTVRINLFPLPEQRAIVSKIEQLFTDLDQGISDLKKAQEQLKIYRQAVLKKAFEGEYRNQKLGVISEVKRGKSKHRPRNDKSLFGGDYPFIQTGEIRATNGGVIMKYTNTYSEKGLAQSKLWPKGTLCLTIAANIGETAFLGFDACFPDSIVGIIPSDNILAPKYLNYYIQKIKKEMDSKASATAQKNINVRFLESLNIPTPSLEIQHQIVRGIESRLSICDKIEENIKDGLLKAVALRQSILKKAFEGMLLSKDEIERCKQEADYEPASVLLEKIRKENKNQK